MSSVLMYDGDMDRKLRGHHEYVTREIGRLEKKFCGERAAALLAYHQDMVKNFQHERLIHLVVTLFFAAMMFGAIGVFSWVTEAVEVGGWAGGMIVGGTGFLAVAVLVTTLFYVRHYYKLENGCEKLYALTEELFKIQRG